MTRTHIPTEFMGVNTKEAYDRVINSKDPVPVSNPVTNTRNIDGMIPIPGTNIHFAKERTYLNKSWNDTHSLLASENLRMPTIPEFIEALKYFKSSRDNELQTLYNEITEVRSPWRANWLDADFKVINGILHINYNHSIQNGILTPRNSEPLNAKTLMENRTPGVSLDSWLSNSTSQGLPKTDITEGKLYYWSPMSDNNSVARFDADSGRADLGCYGDPSGASPELGVYAVAQGV